MPKKKLLLLACSLLFLFVGCEEFKKLFLPHGQIQIGTGGGGSSSSSSISKSNYQILYSSLYPPGGVVFTIEKIQITKDGSNWITLLDGPVEINTENAWTKDSIGRWTRDCWASLTNSVEIEEGEYCALRIWVGPNVIANDNWLEYSASSVTIRTDFNAKLYPLYICQGNGPWYPDTPYVKLVTERPISVERGKRTEVVIFIDDYKLISGIVERFEDWPTFRDSLNNHDITGNAVDAGANYYDL